MSEETEVKQNISDDKSEENSKRFFTHFRWWPHYIVICVIVMIVVTVAIAFLANLFPVPDDAPAMAPFPDEGENIPGPEWLFLLFWSPFWYFAGSAKKYLFLMPLVPMLLGLFFVFLPYLHKIPFGKIPVLGALLGKIRNRPTGLVKSFIYAIPVLLFSVSFVFATYKSGHQAKVLGCESCHNRAMGPRMAIPPIDVAQYYTVDRARQIQAKYRAGKTAAGMAGGSVAANTGGEEGYKNANWQMRHMYEPTFTW